MISCLGIPIVCTLNWPRNSAPGCRKWHGLHVPSATVAVALMHTPRTWPVSESIPDGKSIAMIGLPALFAILITEAIGSLTLPLTPVPSNPSTITSQSASSCWICAFSAAVSANPSEANNTGILILCSTVRFSAQALLSAANLSLLTHNTTTGLNPSLCKWRAATKASPPLLPAPTKRQILMSDCAYRDREPRARCV